jgi:hypothetical protein
LESGESLAGTRARKAQQIEKDYMQVRKFAQLC